MGYKRIDKTFSRYIRLRDSDEYGRIKCCTCPTVGSFAEMQCGHYYSRNSLKIRWDERNAHGQCHECNCYKSGNEKEYEKFMENKYSEEDLKELWDGHFLRFDGFMQHEIDGIVAHYKQKLKQLIKKRS